MEVTSNGYNDTDALHVECTFISVIYNYLLCNYDINCVCFCDDVTIAL